MDPPEIFEAFARELPWLMDATKNHAQVKVMINQLKATSLLLVISIIASGSSLARMRGQNSTPATQGKTVVLDVPSIAERVNEVVVNVRSTSENGENLGSGFIIDQRGYIATNFHLISNAEPRRGSSQRGPEQQSAPKLVTNITVTLHDGRQFPASIKGYDEATDIALL